MLVPTGQPTSLRGLLSASSMHRPRTLLAIGAAAALVLLALIGAVSYSREFTLDEALDVIRIERLTRQAEMVGERTAGMTVSVTLRLDAPIRINRLNRPVLGLFEGFEPYQAPRVAGERHAPFSRTAAARRILRDGEPFDEPLRPGAVLRPGHYQIATTWWYWGLRPDARGAPECKARRDVPAELTRQLVSSRSLAMRTDAIARRTESSPLLEGQRFTLEYAHDQWLADLERLPLPECVG